MDIVDYVLMSVGDSTTGIVVSAAESRYGATYMGDFCVKNIYGDWTTQPVAIFYQPNPDTTKGHSHYFGLAVRQDTVLIMRGDTAFDEPIAGIVSDAGEVIFSRYRHDYCTSQDGTVSIDGGRDYVKTIGNIYNAMVHVVPDGPNLKIIPMPTESN